MLNKLFARIQQFFLPYTCILCQSASDQPRDLCYPCQQDLPYITSKCFQCSRPLAGIQDNSVCGDCLQNHPYFDNTIALFHYQQPIAKLIIALKFQDRLLYAKLFGELLAEIIAEFYQQTALPDMIIPVPLHPQRLKERGFNQALELAKPISKKLALPIDYNSLQRTRITAAQSLIPADKRYQNVKNAFALKNKLSYKHVAIIDDVMTTGHTVNELSRVLKANGVNKVDIWCIARAGN